MSDAPSVNHLCGSPLDLLQYVYALLTVLENPEVDTAFHLWCHQCWAEGRDHR